MGMHLRRCMCVYVYVYMLEEVRGYDHGVDSPFQHYMSYKDKIQCFELCRPSTFILQGQLLGGVSTWEPDHEVSGDIPVPVQLE